MKVLEAVNSWRRNTVVVGNDLWHADSNHLTQQQLEHRRARNIGYQALLFAAAFLVLLAIILIKSQTTTASDVDGVLLVYTFFVTIFQLSRLVASLFYTASYERALSAHEAHQEPFTPAISFVIPAYNEEKEIARTIRNCYLSHYPPEKTEVIVINDASTDGTRDEIVKMKQLYPQLVFVDWVTNKGKRHGMAEGFRRASGELVIQLDSDSRIDPRDIHNVVEPFRNPRVGAVSYHTEPVNADANILTRMQAAYYFLSFRILKAAESTFRMVFCCSGCASAYRREMILPLLDDWLKETFLGLPVTWGDDRSITNRVIQLGYETMYSSSVRAYTIVPTTLKQFIKQQIRWKKGWFVNSIFASKFIIKRDPFVAFTYFFPLMIVTIMTPVMASRAFIYTPLVHGFSSTLYYMLGVFAVAALFLIFYRLYARENPYYPYVFLWACLNMIVLSYMLFVALVTIQNRGWGTRETHTKPQPTA
jgi:hyaluronan synthase